MNHLRIAWLLTAAPDYWHPLLKELAGLFPQTTLFTAGPFQFARGYENSFQVEVVGERRVIHFQRSPQGYSPSIMVLSPRIVGHLRRFQPDVIFADGFCLWTILVLLLKPWMQWRVVLVYDGSSPTVDYRSSWSRLFLRRNLMRWVDAVITNNMAGKRYLVDTLGARIDRVFVRPYLVGDAKALLQPSESFAATVGLKQPTFLCVGKIIPRKGVRELLAACSILNQQGYRNYTLLIVGEGWQRAELEAITRSDRLDAVQWVGKAEYSRLGHYYKNADVLIFPTLEDVWGVVVSEAMAFGKPVLCSKAAGAAELIVEGETGYCFDPGAPNALADLMRGFIINPQLAAKLGTQAAQSLGSHTSTAIAQFFAEVALCALETRSVETV
jgi:glycosyltransferase involved in cell wall biosynthesis